MPGAWGGATAGTISTVRVAILGPLEVHDDGGAPVAVAGVRLRGLIARLAVAPDDVDALHFERHVAEGAVAEALALWRGPALATRPAGARDRNAQPCWPCDATEGRAGASKRACMH